MAQAVLDAWGDWRAMGKLHPSRRSGPARVAVVPYRRIARGHGPKLTRRNPRRALGFRSVPHVAILVRVQPQESGGVSTPRARSGPRE